MQSKSYLLGRLLAVFEREGALATTPQRAYELASLNSVPVLVPAIAKLNGMGKGDAIMDIMVELPMNAFSNGVLTSKEQADFALGYYHERNGVTRLTSLEEDTTAFTDRYEVRMEPDLKQWMLAHGGAQLIRSLLRAERERQSQQ